ncbi:excisionase [Yersinia kristensenii]|uniref:excisionase n=1 Tax=Yersinia kristensenii TaxID=28152 RepID=UPI003B984F6B
MRQIYRWVDQGKIFPPPEKIGRDYEVEETATYINPPSFTNPPSIRNNLIERIKNGSKKAIRRTA